MKLRTKIFASYLIGIVVLLSAIAISVSTLQERELLAALEAEIQLGTQSIARIESNHRKNVTASVQTIAEDWGLRQAAGRRDKVTIKSILINHQARVAAEAGVFVGIDGSIIKTAKIDGLEQGTLQESLAADSPVRSYRTVQYGAKHYSMVAAEVRAPQLVGWLVMLFPLSEMMPFLDQTAEIGTQQSDTKKILVLDFSTNNYALTSSNVTQDEVIDIQRALLPIDETGIRDISIDQHKHLANVTFLSEDKMFYLIVIDSIDAALAPLVEFQHRILEIFAIFGALALIASYLFSKRLTNPLGALVKSAEKLEDGDFSFELNVKQRDEIGDLALAFKSMQHAIEDREVQLKNTLIKLKYQATHDSLTGLANRVTLQEQLDVANKKLNGGGPGFSLCILDLDRFKIVNDTSGHAAGDQLLVKIGEIIKDSIYDSDIAIRLGGDEFALLLYGCSTEDALRVCNNLRQRIEDLVFLWEGTTHRVGVSIGVITITEPVGDIAEVMQKADAGCFIAKDKGRNQVYQVTETDTVEQKREELHWVQRLHNAIELDELILYAQPVVPTNNKNEDTRFEVLVRMRNYHTGEMVPPNTFILSAERYGLNTKIDRWVVTQLLKTAHIYNKVFSDERVYWVNLSAASLGDDEFIDFLKEAIEYYQVSPGTLNFEITETTVIKNLDQAVIAMQALRKLGCQFALDDFGTGLTSFEYVKLLPLDILKIDGRYITNILTDPIDRIFVKSIVDIAHEMEIKTVAEHVENPAILNEVTNLGADYAQGYFLGEPEHILPGVVTTTH